MERRGRLAAEALEEPSRGRRGELVNVIEHKDDVVGKTVLERVAEGARKSISSEQRIALGTAREARRSRHLCELRHAKVDRARDSARKRGQIRRSRCHRVPGAFDVGRPLGEQRRLAEPCVCRDRRQTLRECLVKTSLERRARQPAGRPGR